ncbi:tRNA-specific adenosine deaminase [bioreactor metagenome]|uniref:tRNA-specific adenosine deaminase n=1 Tax=bioreactor metagenome TaxID=1076179 RepID=A0A644U0T5_9ZZZZ|nr:nucleoside deaminase [Methanobrevibacter sp.]MEA4956449.1 nucleoside deaminase [Methanobrevibacter sp.]
MDEINKVNDNYFINEAIKEAKKSFNDGGIPIGAVLVKDGEIIGRGHNKLIQNNSAILHGELDAIENANKEGRLNGEDYKKSTLYTTLSPCPMCSGAVILYKIPKVVIGENKTLLGAENLLMSNGVKVVSLNNPECKELLQTYINENSEEWKKELEKVDNNTSTN